VLPHPSTPPPPRPVAVPADQVLRLRAGRADALGG
jgi:hypothetical protein